MLPERVFLIGGTTCLLAGALWVGFMLVEGLAAEVVVVLYPGALFLLFGAIFVYVGLAARRERRALLRLGEAGDGSVGAAPTRGSP
jgi:hypothetical protein